MQRPRPEPFLVKPEQVEFSFVCPDCVYEKHSPLHPDRPPFARATSVEEEGVVFKGSLPLDEDSGMFMCDYGHEQFVVRQGSERAANFGV